jgi:hypothetical protein
MLLVDHVEALVDRSQKLFVWMHTFIEYLVKTEIGKLEVIEAILSKKPHAEAEGALDDIYQSVLYNAAGSTKMGKEVVRFTIGFILLTSGTMALLPSALYAFLPPSMMVLYSEFETVFKKLAPILLSSSGADIVRVYHTTFLDFCADARRCGRYWTSLLELHSTMANGCFEIMESGTRNAKRQLMKPPSGLCFNICGLETSHLPNAEVADPKLSERIARNISPELLYSCIHWADHYASERFELHPPLTDSRTTIPMVHSLLCTSKALFWLEAMSLTENMTHARNILVRFGRQSSLQVCDPFAICSMNSEGSSDP